MLHEPSQLGELIGDLFIGGQALGQVPQERVLGRLDRVRLDRGGGDQAGVQLIVLGPPALEAREQAHLDGLVHDHLEAGRFQGRAHRPLIAAGRLQADPGDLPRVKPGDQLGEARRPIGDLDQFIETMHGHVELELADIDAGDLPGRLVLSHRPILVASDPIVPATIRASEPSVATLLPLSPRGSEGLGPSTDSPPGARDTPGGRPGRQLKIADLKQTRGLREDWSRSGARGRDETKDPPHPGPIILSGRTRASKRSCVT